MQRSLESLLTRGPKKEAPAENGGRDLSLTQDLVAEPTGLEPATSDVTGRRSNQLNYDSARNLIFKWGQRGLSIKLW